MKIAKFCVAFVSLFLTLHEASGADFSASVVVPTAQELAGLLSGRTMEGTYADGSLVQSKYGTDGSLTASAPRFYDTGRGRVEDGKVCGSLRKIGDFCNDARFDSGVLLLRRLNGKIVRYELK